MTTNKYVKYGEEEEQTLAKYFNEEQKDTSKDLSAVIDGIAAKYHPVPLKFFSFIDFQSTNNTRIETNLPFAKRRSV